MPAVSVIMPAFDAAKYIAGAIASVQAQTFTDWELIVVDDASADDTPTIVSTIADHDQRIRLFRMPRNSGAGATRQRALEEASGRYIAFLDADDLWLPEKLEKQVAFLNDSKQHFTFSFYGLMDEAGKPIGKIVGAPQPLTYKNLFYCNFVGNLTGIYDTHRFGKIGISNIRKRQDWMVWLTVMKEVKTAYAVPEKLAMYRVRTDSISASKIAMLKYNYAVYRNYHHLSMIGAMLAMARFLYTQLWVKPKFIRIE